MSDSDSVAPKLTLHIVNYNLIFIIIVDTDLGFMIESSTHRKTDESATLDPSGQPVRQPIITAFVISLEETRDLPFDGARQLFLRAVRQKRRDTL